MVFVDTSALLAVLDASEQGHVLARDAWEQLVTNATPMLTTNYILVETMALVQHRLGMEAARVFQQDIAPMLQIFRINDSLHAIAVSAVLVANRRNLSLVDCSSFEVMRRQAVIQAFTLDRHFAEQGFMCIP